MGVASPEGGGVGGVVVSVSFNLTNSAPLFLNGFLQTISFWQTCHTHHHQHYRGGEKWKYQWWDGLKPQVTMTANVCPTLSVVLLGNVHILYYIHMILTAHTLTSGVTSTEVLVIGGNVVVHVGIAMVTKDVCLSQALHADSENIKCLRGFASTHIISEDSFSTSATVWDVY